MLVDWAIYGERKGGHALLAASSAEPAFNEITQYTDRPGDPPAGTTWGPVVSGFPLNDKFFLVKTMPDDGASRSGMVRTYAAWLPLDSDHLFSVASALPSDRVQFSTQLAKLDVPLLASPGNSASAELASAHLLAHLGRQPLTTSSAGEFLEMVASIWPQVPVSLRADFAFSLQFSPEHHLPVHPVLVATLPSLRSRFPSMSAPNVARAGGIASGWLAGARQAATKMRTLLTEYNIEPTSFAELELLERFADLTDRLDLLTFADCRRALLILAKFGGSNQPSDAKTKLVLRMTTLIASASNEEILSLRNLDVGVVPFDFSPLLDSIRRWLLTNERPAGILPLLELAVESPSLAWSRPFVEWLDTSTAPDRPHTQAYFGLLGSAPVVKHIRHANPAFLTDRIVSQICPTKFATEALAQNAQDFAVENKFPQLLGTVLARSQSPSKACTTLLELAKGPQLPEALNALVAEVGERTAVAALASQMTDTLLQYWGGVLGERGLSGETLGLLESSVRIDVLAIALHRSSKMNPQLQKELQFQVSTGDRRNLKIGSLLLTAAAKDFDAVARLKGVRSWLAHLTPEATASLAAMAEAAFMARVPGRIPLDAESLGDLATLIPSDTLERTVGEAVNSVEFVASIFRVFQLDDAALSSWLVAVFTNSAKSRLQQNECSAISQVLLDRPFPNAAQIVADTVQSFGRSDAVPILSAISTRYALRARTSLDSLPLVLFVTALPLEREAVLSHLSAVRYDGEIQADVGTWPKESPLATIHVIVTGAGNINATAALGRITQKRNFAAAYFVGVCGGIKDFAIGDVIFGTKVYHYEGGKEDEKGYRPRPKAEETDYELVQLAIRVASNWRSTTGSKAGSAVIASGESVLASREDDAHNFKVIRNAYNDAQAVDMEAYGFMLTARRARITNALVIRGVSDLVKDKEQADQKGNQPLAAQNAASFAFALLAASLNKESGKGLIASFFGLFT